MVQRSLRTTGYVVLFSSGILFGRWIENNQSIRSQYVEDVSEIADTVEYMREIGRTDEEIADTASVMRRGIGARYKAMTPEPMKTRIRERNRKRYGDELGPTVDWLRNRGSTWGEIIEKSQTTGGEDLGL